MVKRSSFPLKIDKWDSKFFKKPVARLTISGSEKHTFFIEKIFDLIARTKRAEVSHLVIKLDSPRISYEKKLLKLGMNQCGESVDLRFLYSDTRKRSYSPDYDVAILKPRYIKEVKDIAADGFRRSYLYRCGFAGEDIVDRYHSRWIENLSKDKDSYVFVVKKKHVVMGFLALKPNKAKKCGRIALIAIHKRYRGKGAGSALVRKCIEWGKGKLASIFVKTQKENRAALFFYKKIGFKTVGHDKIFCIKN